MHLFGTGVFKKQQNARGTQGKVKLEMSDHFRTSSNLRAVAALVLTLAAGMPQGFSQQAGSAPTSTDKAASDLPASPAPILTQPLDLRTSARDYSKPFARLIGNPIDTFKPTSIPKASFANSVRLSDLVKDGKIYLSLSDAIALALENNYDIAIARYNLDIADTDILRTRTGVSPLGVNSGLITNTLGGSASTLTAGGGPGGSTVGSGGAGSGSAGLSLTTAGAGPTPEPLEPAVAASIVIDRATVPSSSFFSGGKTGTDTYDFTYNQGFVTGTALNFTWDNSAATTTNAVQLFSPQYNASFKAEVTQHVLQGAGIWVNKRFMYQALNDRRIADSGFRQQILYTVNQVESIYWGLVQAYEDVLAKQRALEQSSKVASDNRKQLEIGTMAPLDVLNADQSVASDKQALIASQSSLNYQQQIIKQAIARNLNDPALVSAAVIPTDRVDITQIPEETQPIEAVVRQPFSSAPNSNKPSSHCATTRSRSEVPATACSPKSTSTPISAVQASRARSTRTSAAASMGRKRYRPTRALAPPSKTPTTTRLPTRASASTSTSPSATSSPSPCRRDHSWSTARPSFASSSSIPRSACRSSIRCSRSATTAPRSRPPSPPATTTRRASKMSRKSSS